MSYAMSDALQRAVYDRLSGDPALAAFSGLTVFDAALPAVPGSADELHITIGEERVRDISTKTSTAARHDLAVSVHVFGEGFTRAKQAAGAVCDALLGADLVPSRGAVTDFQFLSAAAEKGRVGEPRRVVLRFRAYIEDTV